jgi:hypothetical protein
LVYQVKQLLARGKYNQNPCLECAEATADEPFLLQVKQQQQLTGPRQQQQTPLALSSNTGLQTAALMNLQVIHMSSTLLT